MKQGTVGTNEDPPGDLPGRIGPFRILRLLGEGGMGRVYLAEQDEPRRQLALKVIGGAAASAEYQRRFAREVELLAALEHPGIARLYTAGTAETPIGRVPYLAMEFVRGRDLLADARERNLDLNARLELIARIGRAVHHAHTRGVIHRDLKPANILVDERGEPKVLDFGVAHVVGRDDATPMTVAGEVLGTVPYMPLEQLGGQSGVVDPRWDVYALGVIAYELLSGELPYPGLSKATVLSALQEVLRGAPVRLSRRVPPARGDVETIVMKAMATEPAQRYGSAAELAADIERYLSRQPITARPPTARYVLSLFVRRHRVVTAAAAFAALAIMAGAAVAVRFAYAEAAARHEAELRLAERQAVNDFLQEMLANADPERSLGSTLTVRQLVDAATTTLRADSAIPDAVAGALYRTLGKTYNGLGEERLALDLMEEARRRAVTTSGTNSNVVFEVEVDYATVQIELGAAKEAEARLDDVLARLQRAPKGHERVRNKAARSRARALADQGRLDEAIGVLRDLAPAAQAQLGADDRGALATLYDLTVILSTAGRYDESEAIARDVVERNTRIHGATHPQTLDARNHLAVVYENLGKLDQARELNYATLADEEKVLGAHHPATLTTVLNLTNVLAAQGRLAEGEPLARRAVEGFRVRVGEAHAKSLAAMNVRAYILEDLGRVAEAEHLLREILRIQERRLGVEHPENLAPRNNLAMLLMKGRRAGEAETIFRALVQMATRQLGAEHPHTAIFASNWGLCLTELKRYEEARVALESSLKALENGLGAQHARTIMAAQRLATAYRRLGNSELARQLEARFAEKDE